MKIDKEELIFYDKSRRNSPERIGDEKYMQTNISNPYGNKGSECYSLNICVPLKLICWN
jgi:hypothetical protein